MLNIQKTIQDGKAVLALSGRLDTTTAPELEQEVKATLDGADALTLDLEGLEYISSAGLRVVLTAQKAMAKRNGMKVIHVNETVMDVFEVTGFSDILTIE